MADAGITDMAEPRVMAVVADGETVVAVVVEEEEIPVADKGMTEWEEGRVTVAMTGAAIVLVTLGIDEAADEIAEMPVWTDEARWADEEAAAPLVTTAGDIIQTLVIGLNFTVTMYLINNTLHLEGNMLRNLSMDIVCANM